MSTLRNVLLFASATIVQLQASGPTAAPMSGSVATTTTSTGNYPAASAIYGPFEDGFGSAQASQLTALGCSDPSTVNVPAGVDVFTSEQMIAAQCNVQLPRTENGAHVGLLDACGNDGTGFHEDLDCLYDDSNANSGHSTKVGAATDATNTGVYGRWEDRSNLAIPALDACNGHFGVTPDSNGAVVYHHHVAGLPPFVIGCFGPAADPTNAQGKLVSPTACRALYPECGDGDVVSVTTPTGSRLYDPYCPCFSGFSNVDPTTIPPASPPTSSPLPSPPPTSTPVNPPGCNDMDMTGDFDNNGRATLGDAVHIANARLQYGSTGVNPISCLSGDFDEDCSFTLNDAAQVAEAQFSKAFLPWNKPAGSPPPPSCPGRRQLTAMPATSSTPAIVMEMIKGEEELQVQVHIEREDRLAGAWKALSVQFTGGNIASVHVPHGTPGQVTAQHRGGFFQAASLSGNGETWPVGHAATVTFEAGTDMTHLRIDNSSINSYVVLQADPACKPAKGTPCATMLPRVVSASMPKAVIERELNLMLLVCGGLALLAVIVGLVTASRRVRSAPAAVVATDVKIEPASPRMQTADKC